MALLDNFKCYYHDIIVMIKSPKRNKASAIFSNRSLLLLARMEAYENRHEARKRIMVKAVISSSSDLSAKHIS